MLEFADIFFSFQLAVLGYVITCILMAQDYVLEPYLDLLLKLETKGQLGKWLSKPLGLCEKCTTGQIALWVWLVMNSGEYMECCFTALLRHAIFISFAILSVSVIKNISTKWK